MNFFCCSTSSRPHKNEHLHSKAPSRSRAIQKGEIEYSASLATHHLFSTDSVSVFSTTQSSLNNRNINPLNSKIIHVESDLSNNQPNKLKSSGNNVEAYADAVVIHFHTQQEDLIQKYLNASKVKKGLKEFTDYLQRALFLTDYQMTHSITQNNETKDSIIQVLIESIDQLKRLKSCIEEINQIVWEAEESQKIKENLLNVEMTQAIINLKNITKDISQPLIKERITKLDAILLEWKAKKDDFYSRTNEEIRQVITDCLKCLKDLT